MSFVGNVAALIAYSPCIILWNQENVLPLIALLILVEYSILSTEKYSGTKLNTNLVSTGPF